MSFAKILIFISLSTPFSFSFADEYADKMQTNFLKNAPNDVVKAIKKVDTLNSKCRGGSGSSFATMKACKDRDVMTEILESTGWCWGSTIKDAVGAQKHWLPCEYIQE
jgi:hypothetical protein